MWDDIGEEEGGGGNDSTSKSGKGRAACLSGLRQAGQGLCQSACVSDDWSHTVHLPCVDLWSSGQQRKEAVVGAEVQPEAAKRSNSTNNNTEKEDRHTLSTNRPIYRERLTVSK